MILEKPIIWILLKMAALFDILVLYLSRTAKKINWFAMPWPVHFMLAMFVVPLLICFNFVKICSRPVIRFFLAIPRTGPLRTSETRFRFVKKLGYEFQSHYIYLSGSHIQDCERIRMHFIDEGPRHSHHVALLLHGSLTWSFLYRKVIPIMTKFKFRVVVPDLVGFGKSDKLPFVQDYTLENHVQSLLKLVNYLNLSKFSVIGHELGGLLGSSLASRIPERVEKIILIETGLPQGKLIFDERETIKGVGRTLSVTLKTRTFLLHFIWRLLTNFLGKRFLPSYFLMIDDEIDPMERWCYDAPYPAFHYTPSLYKASQMYPIFQDEEIVIYTRMIRNFFETSFKGESLIISTATDNVLTDQAKLLKNLLPFAKVLKVNKYGLILDTYGDMMGRVFVDFVRGKI